MSSSYYNNFAKLVAYSIGDGVSTGDALNIEAITAEIANKYSNEQLATIAKFIPETISELVDMDKNISEIAFIIEEAVDLPAKKLEAPGKDQTSKFGVNRRLQTLGNNSDPNAGSPVNSVSLVGGK